jgi:hypothetical protein
VWLGLKAFSTTVLEYYVLTQNKQYGKFSSSNYHFSIFYYMHECRISQHVQVGVEQLA